MTPTEILDPVRTVLGNANRGKGDRPCMLSSYQVLDRLPEGIRNRLIEEHGGAGTGVGANRSAAHVVAHALDMLERREEALATYIDTEGLQFRVASEWIHGGYGQICKLYQQARG